MFATDPQGLCAECKMKGRLILCPFFKVACHANVKENTQKNQSANKNTYAQINETDRELEN
jgi:hypothetical protein